VFPLIRRRGFPGQVGPVGRAKRKEHGQVRRRFYRKTTDKDEKKNYGGVRGGGGTSRAGSRGRVGEPKTAPLESRGAERPPGDAQGLA